MSVVTIAPHPAEKSKSQRKQEGDYACVLLGYERQLKEWQKRYAPAIEQSEWDERFVFSCHALPLVSFLVDCLHSPDAELRKQTANVLLKDSTLEQIEMQLRCYTNETEADAIANKPLIA